MSITSKLRGGVAKARALAGTHAGQQVGRFVRVAGMAALVGWIDGGRVISWPGLSAAAVGGVEVAYRQWRQTVTAADVAVTPVVPEPVPVSVPVAVPVPGDPVPEVAPVDPNAAEGGDPQDPSQGL